MPDGEARPEPEPASAKTTLEDVLMTLVIEFLFFLEKHNVIAICFSIKAKQDFARLKPKGVPTK